MSSLRALNLRLPNRTESAPSSAPLTSQTLRRRRGAAEEAGREAGA